MSFLVLITEAFSKYRDEHIIMLNLSPKTEEAYLNTGKLLERYFGNIDMRTLDFEAIRNWRTHLSTYQRPDTVRNNIVNLRNVLKHLRRKQISVIDYELIPVQKREKRIRRYLTEAEYNRFLKEAQRKVVGYSKINRLRNAALIETIYATGLRSNELCALNRDTIRDRQFTVIGKSKDPRIGYVDYRATKAIKEYLAERKDNNPALFISPQTGKRITDDTLRKIFQNICARSDEFNLVTPRTIRHSYATKLLRKKVDIRYIKDLMGHQSIETTAIYTHYENPQLREIYDNAHGLLT